MTHHAAKNFLRLTLGACLLGTCLLAGPAALLQAQTRAVGGKSSDITFDNIKFPMKKTERFKREMLTEEIEALDGEVVRIRGYILPSFQQKGITQFVLVRDNMQCCFGPGAALYDCILVEMQAGKSTSFTVRPIAVEGVFSVRPYKGPDGKHLAIYHLEGQNVK